MPLVHLKMRNNDNTIIEGVVWLLEDQDDLIDAQTGKLYGKVGDLYRGQNVIVETPDGTFSINPKNIISIEPVDMSQFEE